MNWLFAYGSLLPARHAALPDGAVAAHLLGWRRSWSVAMDNSVDLPGYRHSWPRTAPAPTSMVCYLDIAERGGAAVDGVALRVGADELPALDERERDFERCEVAGRLDVQLGGRVWAYVGRRGGRARARRGRRERRMAWRAATCQRVVAGFGLLRQRRRFEALTEPRGRAGGAARGRPPHSGGRAAQCPLTRA